MIVGLSWLNKREADGPLQRANLAALAAERQAENLKSDSELVQALGMSAAAFARLEFHRDLALEIVVRRGKPCATIARNGIFGLPPSAFNTVTLAFTPPSLAARPVSTENEISGTRQPRQRVRPSSQLGAFSIASGIE